MAFFFMIPPCSLYRGPNPPVTSVISRPSVAGIRPFPARLDGAMLDAPHPRKGTSEGSRGSCCRHDWAPVPPVAADCSLKPGWNRERQTLPPARLPGLRDSEARKAGRAARLPHGWDARKSERLLLRGLRNAPASVNRPARSVSQLPGGTAFLQAVRPLRSRPPV